MGRKFALIGYGAIGSEIGAALERLGEAGDLVAVLVRPGRDAGPFLAVNDVDNLVASGAEMVLECAGHEAVRAHGEAILRAGLRLVISSVGVLADEAFAARLRAADAGRRLAIVPSGAIAGLDGLAAAKLAGLEQVTYVSKKPPYAWRGTAAEAVIDLDHPELERVFFEGSAREAALAYPKNANVSVAVALAGLGLDRTEVRLVSSRMVEDPLGIIEAEGAFGTFRFDILALASRTNPKTSALTGYSLLQCARLGLGLPAFPPA